MYRSMIDSLLYLTTSRPNIAFNVEVCARYQSKPKESHLAVVKQIIRYVNSTFSLVYGTLKSHILILKDMQMLIGLKT